MAMSSTYSRAISFLKVQRRIVRDFEEVTTRNRANAEKKLGIELGDAFLPYGLLAIGQQQNTKGALSGSGLYLFRPCQP